MLSRAHGSSRARSDLHRGISRCSRSWRTGEIRQHRWINTLAQHRGDAWCSTQALQGAQMMISYQMRGCAVGAVLARSPASPSW